MQQLVVLATDPGVVNHGYAVVSIPHPRLKSSLAKFRILQYGRLHTTVRDLKSKVSPQSEAYCATLESLRLKFSPSAFIAERYQSRRMGGTTIECVNIMLGLSIKAMSGLSTKILPASQWKNAAAKAEFWFDELYLSLRPNKITPHAIDAVCIALYGVGLLTKSSPPFHFVNMEAVKRKLLRAKHLDLGDPPQKVPRKPKKVRRGTRKKLLSTRGSVARSR